MDSSRRLDTTTLNYFLRGHERSRNAPIAVARAATDGPHPHVVRGAWRQSHQHNPACLRVNARLRPGAVAVQAGLHLIRPGVAVDRREAQRRLRAPPGC